MLIPTPTLKYKERKPKSMQRAKQWIYRVENAYRFQSAGFRDIEEYLCYIYNTIENDVNNHLVF